MTKNRMGVVITGLKMGVSVSIVTPFPLRDCCKITPAAHGINSSLLSPHFSHTQLHIRTHGMHTHAKHKNVYRGIQRNFRNCSHLSFHIPNVAPTPSFPFTAHLHLLPYTHLSPPMVPRPPPTLGSTILGSGLKTPLWSALYSKQA